MLVSQPPRREADIERPHARRIAGRKAEGDFGRYVAEARHIDISEETLSPLDARERAAFLRLLEKMR